MPLGGSQSAACYLARALASQGHEIIFLTHTSTPGTHAGVACLSWARTPLSALPALKLDVFICVLGAGNGRLLREVMGPGVRLILWTQHRCDQWAVQSLAQAAERESYDAFAFVSEWQRTEFIAQFALPPHGTHILRNAVAPAFLELFTDDQPILPQKLTPPLLAYTSTPFRGLDLLVEAFPAIRMRVPGTQLRVFSSMCVYQAAPADDQRQYGALYELCRRTPGVEYIGSISQPELAREMRGVAALAYPNTFPETSCIAALEAMASGCGIVTSALGALPETTAGFAQLVSVAQSREGYLREFIERMVAVLHESIDGDRAAEEPRRQAVEYIRNTATWGARAAQWSELLERLSHPPPASGR